MMNAADRRAAERLFSILAGREPTDKEHEELFADARELQAFRIRLLSHSAAGSSAAGVVARWKREIRRRIDEPSASELLIAVERAAEQQGEIHGQLQELGNRLLAELRALDELSLDMGQLREQMRVATVSLEQLRQAVLTAPPSAPAPN